MPKGELFMAKSFIAITSLNDILKELEKEALNRLEDELNIKVKEWIETDGNNIAKKIAYELFQKVNIKVHEISKSKECLDLNIKIMGSFEDKNT